jgi:hypothetical protein
MAHDGLVERNLDSLFTKLLSCVAFTAGRFEDHHKAQGHNRHGDKQHSYPKP